MIRVVCFLLALAPVLMAQNPPSLTSILPSSAPAGSPARDLTVNGSGFDPCTRVRWNGTDLAGYSLINSNQMKASMPATLLASPGSATVTVFRFFSFAGPSGPACLTTGQSSNGLTFTITAPPPSITTSSPLPDGIFGRSYSVNMNATGGTLPYVYGLGGSAPPPGLTLTSGGLLSGIPSQAGTFSFRVTVTDCNGVQSPGCTPQSSVKGMQATITLPPPPVITTASLPNAIIGRSYAERLQATDGVPPYVFTLVQALTTGPGSSLPPGFSLTTTGAIAGVAAQAGLFNFAVRVTDCGNVQTSTCTPQNTAKIFSINVPPLLTITTDGMLPGGTSGQSYSAQIQAAGGVTPYRFTVDAGSSIPAGLSLAPGGTLSGIPTTSGLFSFSVRVDDCSGVSGCVAQTASKVFSLTIQSGISITTPALATATACQTYSQNMTASGGALPYTWSANGLPQGLSIHAATGVISGAATSAATATVTVIVTDTQQQRATRNYTLTVGASQFQITTSSLPGGVAGSPYPAASLQASGGTQPYSWSADAQLPPGLTVGASTGAITGIPTQAGSFSPSFRVADANSCLANRQIPVQIDAGLQITTAVLNAGVVAQPYSQTVQASGGTQPYQWTATGLAPGLQIGLASGVISGSPSQAGTFNVIVSVEDGAGRTVRRVYTLMVTNSLTITTAALAGGRVGLAYDQTVVAQGGASPLSWSATGLPPGLGIDAGTGRISGIPTLAGDFAVTVQTRDASGATVARTFQLNVVSLLRIITDTLLNSVVGTAYSQTLQATGGFGPFTWSLSQGALPEGLNIATLTGVISGTPTRAGTFSFTISVRDGTGQTAQQSYIADVVDRLTLTTMSLPAAAVGVAYSATVAATGGEAPYAWSATGALPDGLTLNAMSGVISGTPTRTGSFDFTVLVRDRNNQSANRSFRIAVGSGLIITTESLPGAVVGVAYTASISASGGDAPYAWSATGALPDGLTLNATSGVISGTPTRTGSFDFTVLVRDRNNQLANRSFRIAVGSGLIITTESLPGAVVGVAYSATVAAAGGDAPYAWSATGILPDGLTLNATSGVISGTPTRAGSFDFTVLVRDRNNQSANRSFRIAVGSGLTITTESLPGAVVGVTYSATVAAAGGDAPYAWTATGILPDGLTLNGTTGVVSGTPTRAGSFDFTVLVRDRNNQSANRGFRIAVGPGLTITTESLPGAVAGVAYTASISAAGGEAPYSWTVSGNLPDGLLLNGATGLISGTPSRAGSYDFTAVARDRNNLSVMKAFRITVGAGLTLTITTESLPGAVTGVAYSATISAVGGEGPYTWTVTGNLPDGLTLNETTGVISGMPSRPGSFSFTVHVQDRGGRMESRSFTVTAVATLTITTDTLPAGMFGARYSTTVQAAGGRGERAWSASGLPNGLVIIAATGEITGVPVSSGDFTVSLTVLDSEGATALRAMTLRIANLVISRLNITSENTQPGQQSTVRLALMEIAPLDLRGELRVSFASQVGVNNPQVTLSTGQTAGFRIAAGSTEAQFDAGAVTLQTGTVAGTITLSASLAVGQSDVTPAPAPATTITVERAAPVIASLAARRDANRLILEVTGFATSREITAAEVRFETTPGANTGNTNFTIQVGSAFGPYYQSQGSIPFGSSFFLTIPFDVTGNTGIFTSVTVTLINVQGRSQVRSANF